MHLRAFPQVAALNQMLPASHFLTPNIDSFHRDPYIGIVAEKSTSSGRNKEVETFFGHRCGIEASLAY